MFSLTTASALFTLLLPLPISASVGVLDIDNLLQPNSNNNNNNNLFVPAEDQPYAPWSHKPHCTTSTALTHLGQKYCVFTSNVTGPYGLSLIFTPTNAQRAREHLFDIPLNSFLTQDQSETLYSNPAPWKIVDIPGKDKGVVATRKIYKYETFMIDQAAVVLDMDLENAISGTENNKLLKVAIDRLRTPEIVRDMSPSANDQGDSTLEENIMKTNAFGSTVAGIGTRTLFPTISRINHACNPNAFVMFSRAGVSMAIKAYRDIEPGEEISISYTLLGLPSSKRAHLLQRWGFKCTCPLCSLPPREKQASDLRRAMITQVEEKIIELAGAGRVDEAIQLAEEGVQLVRDEGLESLLTDEYAMLAMLWLEKGDRGKAHKYGKMAWRLLGDLGYLGVGEEVPRFSLDKLLKNIGGMGGDGKGKMWKTK